MTASPGEDLDRWRAETPGCADHTHFNNAGAALMPQLVIDRVKAHLELEGRLGGYEAAALVADELQQVRATLAQLVGAEADQMAFTDNATRGWQTAFFGLLEAAKPGDRVIVGQAEYGSNHVALLRAQQRWGVEIDLIGHDEAGDVDLVALEAAVTPRTVLICLTHMPSNGGTIHPAEAVGGIAEAHNIPFLLDTCQTAGQVPLDVTALKCTALSGTGRKFLRAPRGTGFLWVHPEWITRLQPPYFDMTSAAFIDASHYELYPDYRRFELFEKNIAGLLGLGTAVDYALQIGMETIAALSAGHAARIRSGLAQIEGVTCYDQGRRLGAITTFAFEAVDALEALAVLKERGFFLSASEAWAAQFDAEKRNLPVLLRASPHYTNSQEEVDALVAAIADLTGKGP